MEKLHDSDYNGAKLIVNPSRPKRERRDDRGVAARVVLRAGSGRAPAEILGAVMMAAGGRARVVTGTAGEREHDHQRDQDRRGAVAGDGRAHVTRVCDTRFRPVAQNPSPSRPTTVVPKIAA